MLTSICNLQCDYCFARDTFSQGQPTIPIDTFRKIVSFITKYGEQHIGLIGGEPLLHPQFDKIVSIALENNDPGNIMLFTNGIMIDKYIDILRRSMIKIMINCNGADILGENKERFLDNLELCFQQLNWDKSITLSYNLYKKDQDFSEILKIVDHFPVKTIRMAVASPSHKQRYMDPSEYFSNMKDVAIDFFSEINKRKIRIVMDCNIFPNCMQKDILDRVTHPFVRRFPKSVCTPVLDFCIDETVVRCFGLSDVRIDMNNFSSLAQLQGYFCNLFDSQAYLHSSELKCRTCIERQCMGCMNGCLSYNARRQKFMET